MKLNPTLIVLIIAGASFSCADRVPHAGNNAPEARPGKVEARLEVRKAEGVSKGHIARTLAGSWHCNTDGATKRFIPFIVNKKPQAKGTAYGFWPTGGTYVVTHEDVAKRSLDLVISIEKTEDQDAERFTAKASFDAAGKNMTFTRAGGESFPYYRTR